jgi:dTDP-4-dehydrorhamnose 3,5-epimerase-like enzyme
VTVYADIGRVQTIRLPTNVDARGVLTAIEGGVDIPFEIKRLFYMWGVQAPYERGSHAHRETEHLLVCVAGRLTIDLSDPQSTESYELDDPAQGLYIPPMIWTYLHDFTVQTVCLAAASTHYDNSKVIRNWDEYRRLAGAP